jgi:hypothetical protein
MATKTIQAIRIIWTGTPTGTLPAGAYAVSGGKEMMEQMTRGMF